jgi:hypothetical protein
MATSPPPTVARSESVLGRRLARGGSRMPVVRARADSFALGHIPDHPWTRRERRKCGVSPRKRCVGRAGLEPATQGL